MKQNNEGASVLAPNLKISMENNLLIDGYWLRDHEYRKP